MEYHAFVGRIFYPGYKQNRFFNMQLIPFLNNSRYVIVRFYNKILYAMKQKMNTHTRNCA